jgi:dihydrofolate reductase
MQRKLIIYIASSLDGYIAAPGEDLSFLNDVAQDNEDYGYGAFIETVDTIFMGRKTYDWVLKHAPFPHTDKEVFIVTRSPRPPRGNITFYTGSLRTLVEQLKHQNGKHIFCDGGAEVIHALLLENLVDEVIISIIPVLLGSGIQLFKEGRSTQNLKLISSKTFPSGLVQLRYTFKSTSHA